MWEGKDNSNTATSSGGGLLSSSVCRSAVIFNRKNERKSSFLYYFDIFISYDATHYNDERERCFPKLALPIGNIREINKKNTPLNFRKILSKFQGKGKIYQ